MGHTCLASQLKFVKGLGYESYITKEFENDRKEDPKGDEEAKAEEEKEAPVPPVTLVNDILSSIFSNVEVYINNQKIYNSYGLYAHKSHNSNNLKGAIFEYKGVLHCEGYGCEVFSDELIEAPMSEPFFTRRMKMLSRPDGFMLYINWGLTFSHFLNC